MANDQFTHQQVSNIEVGALGTTLINSNTPYVGRWRKIQCISQVEFSTLTDSKRDGDSVAGIVFSSGTVLHGAFTAITVLSGSCIAYKSY